MNYSDTLKSLSLAFILLFAALSLATNPDSSAAAQSTTGILPSIDTDSTIVTGRIVSTLEPVSGMDQSAGNMTAMQDMDDQAKRFSMAQNVTWLLSGDWALIADKDGNNITFAAEFIKTTTDGTMLHTHKITNFKSVENLSAANLSGENVTISGTSDVYFNDELAWEQAATDLTLINGTILVIDLGGVDNHFHGQPIYGIISSIAENGTYISIPQTDISEAIEEEFSGLGANATQAGQSIANETSEAARTFAEETTDVIGNITQSVRNLFS